MTAFCMQTYKMLLPNDRLQDIRFALSRIRDDASLRTGYMVFKTAGSNFWCSWTSRRILFLLIIETSD